LGSALQKKLDAAVQHHRQNELAEAERLYRQVLAKDRGHPGASHLLGALLLQQGRNADAVALIRDAIARAPDHPLLAANLGEAYRRIGDRANAIANLGRAVALQPTLAEAHHNLGLALHTASRLEDAAASYRRAIALRPGMLPSLTMLARALRTLEQVDESLAAWARALEVDGTCAEAHDGMGGVLLDQGRIDDAIASFRRAVELRPQDPVAHGHLVYTLGLRPGESSSSIVAEATCWRERHAHVPRGPRPYANDRDPKRRLRVGYLSPDFRNHSHSLFLLPLFEHHDRRQVEVCAYSLVQRPDEFTERTRALVDRFRDASTLDDAVLVEAIRADGIDVLVDVTMHLAGNRLVALSDKPAPVQVIWLAYPGTTGLDAIDYRITDPYLDPPDVDSGANHTEQPIRLPETFWCYAPLTDEPKVGPLPAHEGGRITFGSLNNFNRTNAEVFALWSSVLRAVDGSRMILFAWPGEARRRARDAFERGGIDPDRLEFVGFQPRGDYLRVYHRIDVCLDTVPHSGGTTSLDAF